MTRYQASLTPKPQYHSQTRCKLLKHTLQGNKQPLALHRISEPSEENDPEMQQGPTMPELGLAIIGERVGDLSLEPASALNAMIR